MILLEVDLEALLHGIVRLEALNDLEGDEELSEAWEDKYGFQELEVSPKGELLFLNHTLIGGEKEFDWLIKTSKVFKGRYSVPEWGIENVPLYVVLRKLKEYLNSSKNLIFAQARILSVGNNNFFQK